MKKVLQEWHNRTLAEYRSAAITAQLLHWLIQAGLPQSHLDTAIRIVGDELAHAHLCVDVLDALGGAWQPSPTETATLAEARAPEGLLASIIDTLLPNFLLGETLAVPLFNAMRVRSTHPTVVTALERILRDEAVHRAFGWAVLDELLAIDPEGVRARVEARLPGVLHTFSLAYGEVKGPPVTPEQQAVGLLSPEIWREVFHETVQGDLRTRFHTRGIAFESS